MSIIVLSCFFHSLWLLKDSIWIYWTDVSFPVWMPATNQAAAAAGVVASAEPDCLSCAICFEDITKDLRYPQWLNLPKLYSFNIYPLYLDVILSE